MWLGWNSTSSFPAPRLQREEESGVSPGLAVREQGQAKGLSKAASRRGCCPLTCWEPSLFLLFLQWMARMHHF